MKRITEIEIAGKKYPLNFSAKAAKEVAARYGSIENAGDVFKDKTVAEMMEEVFFLLSLLLTQGEAYMRIVEEKEITVPTVEQLEVILDVADIVEYKGTILSAMTAGMTRTVEVETDPKNGETTPGA